MLLGGSTAILILTINLTYAIFPYLISSVALFFSVSTVCFMDICRKCNHCYDALAFDELDTFVYHIIIKEIWYELLFNT